ncbi:glycoside hydrolase family 13 protein [Gluconobacter morbifer]|nr:alpha-glucosidase [Gluconobacter morbifer]
MSDASQTDTLQTNASRKDDHRDDDPAFDPRWWKEAVVYQVYPRSFCDSNGDGIGDLPGLTSRLDHIRSLGVQVIWLCPHYDTPNVDGGYDVRDYRRIDPALGTMEDFDRLISAIHERGMKLIVDLVVNHTSDQHEWFRQARSSRDSPYRDFYIWRDGRGENEPPNNFVSVFGGAAWSRDEASGQYYLHYFTPAQPDLNWDNPQVRQEVHALMRFWLERGVSGFRMDSICLISKPEGLPDLTLAELENPERIYARGPRLHDYLRDMNHEVLAPHDCMSIGEAFGVSYAETPDFVDASRHELDMLFHFNIIRVGRHDWQVQQWTVREFKALMREEDTSPGPGGWTTTFLENHDNPRSVSWFGDDRPEMVAASARALATLMLLRRGTPFVYQGEEIGMTDIPFTGVQDFEDVHARTVWHNTVEAGKVPAEEVLPQLGRISRDNARTPMQWDDGPQAGFTTGTPWFRLNPRYRDINVARQETDPSSVLNHYRRLIALRAAHRTLIYGDFVDVDPDHPSVIAFTRGLEGERFLVLVNLCSSPVHYILPLGLELAEVLIDSTGAALRDVLPELAPWQAGVYRLKN